MIEDVLISYGGIGVLAFVMIYFNIRADKKAERLEENHRQTIDKLSQVVANNTIALAQLRDSIVRCPVNKNGR